VTEKNRDDTTQNSEEKLAAEVDATEAEVPETETPVVETPEAEAPVADAPEPEAPVTDTPVAEVPETEAPVAEALVTDAPVAEVPETETPDAENPEVEVPVADAPAAEAPPADVPETEDDQEQATEAEESVEDVSEPVAEIEPPAASDEGSVDEEPDFDRDGQSETPSATPRTPRIRERAPSRRTTLRERRRRRATARKSRKRTVYGILGGLVAATLILGIALPSFAGLITRASNSSNDTTADIASVGTQVAVQVGSVLEDGASYGSYSVPPTSGPSYAAGVEWGAYTEQQPNESIVRNLEQGAIVVNYNITDEALIADLTSYLEAQPGYPGCFVAQPYAELAAGAVTITSWGWMETYTGVDRPGMQLFVDDHKNDSPLYVSPTCGADTTLPAEASLDHSGN
jgi:hypothetical protein